MSLRNHLGRGTLAALVGLSSPCDISYTTNISIVRFTIKAALYRTELKGLSIYLAIVEVL